ncbi:MAG: outer membrane beta-barrel protein [Methylocystis sp.]|jgi:outer membrane immunogenic protein
MKTSLLACAAGLLCVGAASAADLPLRPVAPYIPPPPALLFEGLYAGGQLGWAGFGDRAQSQFAPNNAVLNQDTGHSGSVIGGVRAGYDWRYGPLVVGLLGDISGASATNNNADAFFGYGVKNTLDVQGSFRVRVGFNYERVLFYVTGGLNVAHLRRDYQALLGSQNYQLIFINPTLGAGVEYALDSHWRVGLEYRVSGGASRAEAVNFAQPALQTRHQFGQGSLMAGVSYVFGK